MGGEIGEAKELIVRTPEEFKQENGITVLTRHQAVKIEPAAREVLARDLMTGAAKAFPYDKLILAAGARAYIAKRDVAQALVRAIRDVLNGWVLVSPRAANE